MQIMFLNGEPIPFFMVVFVMVGSGLSVLGITFFFIDILFHFFSFLKE